MEFLDYLAVFLGCPYLSDLKRCGITRQQADALRALPIQMFEEKKLSGGGAVFDYGKAIDR